jgi:hypothetical protein
VRAVKNRGSGLAPFEFDPRELAKQYRRMSLTVVADLAEICFADAPTFDPDPRVDARNQGRRDIWLHINQFLKLDPDQLEQIYLGRGQVLQQQEDLE